MEEAKRKSDPRISKLKPIRTKNYDVYGESCIGGRKENQDACFVHETPTTLIMCVCDGMGGMNGGEIASGIAVLKIKEEASRYKNSEICEDVLKDILEKSNDAVYQKAISDQNLLGMGTTAALVIVTREAAYIAHIGDTRVYLLRKGKKKFRTFDHSRVFELVAAGGMTEEQARQSSFSNIITRALGIRPRIEGEFAKIPYKAGDRFIICCDGIWNGRPEAEMIKLFSKYDYSVDEVKYLITEIDDFGFKKGGDHDNLTCIVADMDRDSEFQYPVSNGIKDFFRKLWSGKFKKY